MIRPWLRRAWQFLRELSGEAALERRMRGQCGCASEREAVTRALEAGFESPHRCC